MGHRLHFKQETKAMSAAEAPTNEIRVAAAQSLSTIIERALAAFKTHDLIVVRGLGGAGRPARRYLGAGHGAAAQGGAGAGRAAARCLPRSHRDAAGAGR